MTTPDNFKATGVQSFAVPGNWSAGVPTSSNDAEIASGAVVSSTATETVNSIGLGSNNFLNIQQGSGFIDDDGTGPNDNNGTISVSGTSDLVIDSGTFDNPGTIRLLGDSASDSGAVILPGSSVTLNGGGVIEMLIGGGPQANTISTDNFTHDVVVTNVDNTISGDGTIGEGLDFNNEGTIETNNSTSTSGGTLNISTDSGLESGDFFNESTGILRADDGGTLIFGIPSGFAGSTQRFTNDGNIDVESTGDPTKLEIAGNLTIGGLLGGGRINLGGSAAQSGDEIVSDGNTATLTLIEQTLKGAGTIGDSNLTIDNVSGTINADLAGETLSLGGSPGAPMFTNGGTLEAASGGILSAVNSPIANSGTISAVSGGDVILGSVLSTGAIDIGANSSITLSSEVIGNITFTGDNAKLIITNNLESGGIDGEILGAVATDSIDLTSTAAPYSPSNHLSWQQTSASGGVLSLINSSSQTIEALSLGGTFTSANFIMTADGPAGPTQGTLIEIGNPPPPATTTADMIMDDTSGDYEIYDLGNNTIQAAYALDQISTDWQVAGVGDFAGTDTSDMLLRAPGNGQLEIYDVSNNNISTAFSIGQVGLAWTVVGFGDFSGHANETDMLMQNSSTGQFEVYDISNNQIANAVSMGQVGAPWVVAGFGDFSGHGGETGDMLMRNSSTGAFEVYDIANNQITFSASVGQVGPEWQVAGFGDFSGHANETDMLMRNSNSGAFEVYDISNNQIAGAASMGQVGLEWQVVGFGPINGAGASDMLMRNTNTGAFEVYDIANNQLTAAAPMGQVGPAWSVAGIAVDPPAAPPSQLLQAMASFAPADGVAETASTLGPSTGQPSPLNILNPATAHPSA